ncbi:transporter substrate-binding domain-containing protein [Bacillus sp. FJAT-45066]|uniref:transporter substrate-binding domain-containing protein n=1 Tax=Bacillus sp. FJAT-45066 TaxID=2011010 RepID=UPI000BB7EA79|nr:transporter substrate-binding domain-containing protein [Bacillus sp. FJAT-45066]
MKKVNFLFLFIIVMLTLAACGTANNNQTDTNTNEDAKAQDTSWTDVEESGKIIVGTSGTYSPITYVDESNELTGFDVELVRALGEKLGVEVEFKRMEFDGILPSLRNGQINIAANDFAITEERKETFDFVTPHKFSYGSAIVRAEDANKFEDALALKDVKIGLGSMTSNYAQFANNIGADAVAYDGGAQAILQDVANGNRDAYLNDRLVLLRTLKDYNDDRLALAENVKFHATESAIIMLKGKTALKERLDQAMQELLEDGTVARLSEEFLGEDVSQPIGDSEIIGLDGN